MCIRDRCYGFDELAERAKEFDVKRVSEITWVPEEKIIAAARMLGNAKNSTLQWLSLIHI